MVGREVKGPCTGRVMGKGYIDLMSTWQTVTRDVWLLITHILSTWQQSIVVVGKPQRGTANTVNTAANNLHLCPAVASSGQRLKADSEGKREREGCKKR